MNKPLTVARQEFFDNIAMLINQTPLPAFVVAEMLDVALKRVNQIANQEYEKDKMMWDESLKKAEEARKEEAKSENNKDEVSSVPKEGSVQ
ncbi:MAG: hypothetical protein J5959_13930 [Butyrivibrio sp.]|nr:hypothetical protein [Butyrivibrio sp.]